MELPGVNTALICLSKPTIFGHPKPGSPATRCSRALHNHNIDHSRIAYLFAGVDVTLADYFANRRAVWRPT